MSETEDLPTPCNCGSSIRGLQAIAFPPRPLARTATAFVLAAASAMFTGCASLHRTSDCMKVPVTEYCAAAYPEDPAPHSAMFGCYQGRCLTLKSHCDGKHFDFIFHSDDPRIARVVFRNIDVSLMTPGLPEYVRGDEGLERIAVVDRQWNRQQVQFPVPGPHVEVCGGDGFEVENLAVASLAKNCLNAGLWEVLLFVKEDGKKAMYYQGWFTFPLGHYKRIWEANTGLSYCKDLNWYRMEHWLDPSGTPINLCRLRTPCSETLVDAQFCPCEPIVYDGEQVRKTISSNMCYQQTWADVLAADSCSFATFKKPGRYRVHKPWGNEYGRLAAFEKAIVRTVECPSRPDQMLHEIELVFRPDGSQPRKKKKCCQFKPRCCQREGKCDRCPATRIIVGGIDLNALPHLPVQKYSKGLYMPMGIGVPPFYQTYEELLLEPPTFSPYYSFILNQCSEWIDHHKIAIDGPVLHRDIDNPDLIHMYLLSYERHILVAHLVLPIGQADDDDKVVPPLPEQPVVGAGHSNQREQTADVPGQLPEGMEFP
jgi:hypothetical protein